MTQHINKEIGFQGRRFLVVGLHARWDMFLVQEIGRNFHTLIAFDEVF